MVHSFETHLYFSAFVLSNIIILFKRCCLKISIYWCCSIKEARIYKSIIIENILKNRFNATASAKSCASQTFLRRYYTTTAIITTTNTTTITLLSLILLLLQYYYCYDIITAIIITILLLRLWRGIFKQDSSRILSQK